MRIKTKGFYRTRGMTIAGVGASKGKTFTSIKFLKLNEKGQYYIDFRS